MGYLDDYSEVTGARREAIHKGLLLALLISVVGGGLSYFWFKNFFEERQVSQFLARLQESRYAEAYTQWGCSVEVPCPNYTYEDFLEDWGPDSPLGRVTSFNLGRSTELETGVIVEIEINGKLQAELWVEKETKIVGFSPFHFRQTGTSSSNGFRVSREHKIVARASLYSLPRGETKSLKGAPDRPAPIRHSEPRA